MSVNSVNSENYREDLWDYLESSQPVSSQPAPARNPSDFPIGSRVEFRRPGGTQWTPGIVRGYWFNGVTVENSPRGTSYMARWEEIRPVTRRVFKPKVRAVSPNRRGKSASGGSRRRQRRRHQRNHTTRRRKSRSFK